MLQYGNRRFPVLKLVGHNGSSPRLKLQSPREEIRKLACSCELRRAPLRVAVLLSGGVDSSLCLHLLKKAGHSVTAFYLQIWFQEDFRNFWGACPWEDDLEMCKQVCEKQGVELTCVPLTEQYWSRVVADSIADIQHGRTPNPDMLCNSRVKFGAFLDYLQANHASEFDRVASGHYACALRSDVKSNQAKMPEPQVQLALSADSFKDQTYFLASLTQQQLSRVMFPLGCMTKEEVRRLAAAVQLPNQARKDSQGICFLGKVKFDEFVAWHIGTWPGPLIDEETGAVVGFHQGFWFFTLGQRKGILLSGGPWYVSRKDCRKNAVYISRQYYTSDKQRNLFQCHRFNWISGAPPKASQLRCKVRHGPHFHDCHFLLEEKGLMATVRLAQNDQGLAPGQYAVFYDGNICLGSAVISVSGAA